MEEVEINNSNTRRPRELQRPFLVRDVVVTAYVSLTPGTGGNSETTLFTAPPGMFADLVRITASNTSSAALGATTAVRVDVRAATGAGIVHTMMINDDDMRESIFQVPLPQDVPGATWTVQAGADLSSGSPILISALFIQNL